jgi:hypothetical protein
VVKSRFNMKIANLLPGAATLANAGEGIVFLMFYNKTKNSRKSPKIDLGIHVLAQDMAESVEQVQSMAKLINSDDITGIFSSKKQVYYAVTDDFEQIPTNIFYPKTEFTFRLSIYSTVRIYDRYPELTLT